MEEEGNADAPDDVDVGGERENDNVAGAAAERDAGAVAAAPISKTLAGKWLAGSHCAHADTGWLTDPCPDAQCMVLLQWRWRKTRRTTRERRVSTCWSRSSDACWVLRQTGLPSFRSRVSFLSPWLSVLTALSHCSAAETRKKTKMVMFALMCAESLATGGDMSEATLLAMTRQAAADHGLRLQAGAGAAAPREDEVCRADSDSPAPGNEHRGLPELLVRSPPDVCQQPRARQVTISLLWAPRSRSHWRAQVGQASGAGAEPQASGWGDGGCQRRGRQQRSWAPTQRKRSVLVLRRGGTCEVQQAVPALDCAACRAHYGGHCGFLAESASGPRHVFCARQPCMP